MTAVRTFVRSTRTLCTPFVLLLVFALLLTFVFVLYQPTEGPGRDFQRIGWQSWSVVNEQKTEHALGPLPVDPGSIGAGNSSLPPGVDWWDVEKPQGMTHPSSLPLDKWAPLLPHETGITDITVARCVVSPELTTICNPPTTPEEDGMKGPWVRIPRDLNKKDGLWYLVSLFTLVSSSILVNNTLKHLYYRRSRRLDIPLITEIQLLPKSTEPSGAHQEKWKRASRSLRDGVMGSDPLYLWYKLGPTAQELSESGRQSLITELDILYGKDRSWFGFKKLDAAINEGRKGKVDPVWLTIREGVKSA